MTLLAKKRHFTTDVSQDYLRALCYMPDLNEEFRRLFREKRLSLGLTYKRLGVFFLSHWSTIRKWELGQIFHCNDRVRPLLYRFLSGAADRELKSDVRSCMPGSLSQSMPPLVRDCFQGYIDTYLLCEMHPALQKEMRQALDDITKKAVDDLLMPGTVATTKSNRDLLP